MMVIIVRSDRPRPESPDKMNDQQRIELFRSMSAYGGTYTFHGDRVEHHIDISSNEVWTGTTVIRDIKKEEDRLQASPIFDGRKDECDYPRMGKGEVTPRNKRVSYVASPASTRQQYEKS